MLRLHDQMIKYNRFIMLLHKNLNISQQLECELVNLMIEDVPTNIYNGIWRTNDVFFGLRLASGSVVDDVDCMQKRPTNTVPDIEEFRVQAPRRTSPDFASLATFEGTLQYTPFSSSVPRRGQTTVRPITTGENVFSESHAYGRSAYSADARVGVDSGTLSSELPYETSVLSDRIIQEEEARRRELNRAGRRSGLGSVNLDTTEPF